MKEINIYDITDAVKNMCIDCNYYLTSDVEDQLFTCLQNEPWPMAKEILGKILDNVQISKSEKLPLCQDTGMVCVFVTVGQDIHFVGGNLRDAINEGVRQGYKEGYLRKSVVGDPLKRINTGDNTPAVINYEIVEGDKLKIVLTAKGFGSENMSQLKMLKPAEGIEGVEEFVLKAVADAGSNPCPPIVVGVGIGGTFDRVAYLSKKALIRPFNQRNSDPFYAEIEDELLQKINALGIGPQGFGGKTTALAINIETFPTHIAGLPVAVNINCHVSRHAEAEL